VSETYPIKRELLKAAAKACRAKAWLDNPSIGDRRYAERQALAMLDEALEHLKSARPELLAIVERKTTGNAA
jgi:hypothetical protein